MPKGPLCRTNLARQSAGKPKTKKPKTTDPTGQTQNQKPKFWFWFLVFQKTKNQKKQKKSDPTIKINNQNLGFGFWFFRKPKAPKKHMPLLVLVWPVGSVFFCFFVFSFSKKPKTKTQILVFGFGFDFCWFLFFGLVPGVCIFLLVGFWFFAGGVATYISSSSYKRTLQKPSLVPHLPYKRTLQKPSLVPHLLAPLCLSEQKSSTPV